MPERRANRSLAGLDLFGTAGLHARTGTRGTAGAAGTLATTVAMATLHHEDLLGGKGDAPPDGKARAKPLFDFYNSLGFTTGRNRI